MKTYIRVKGKWCYLYRAIETNPVDLDAEEKRHEALQAFFT